MNFRKHAPLIVGLSLAGLLAIAAAVLLFFKWSASSKVGSEYDAQKSQLEKLNKRKPFPEQANVDALTTNLATVTTVFKKTIESLSAGQIEPGQASGSEFAQTLETLLNRLQKKEAPEAGVKLPAKFGLGLNAYIEGKTASSNNIPRLMVQARTAAALVQLLVDCRVSEVVDIKRDEFETAAASGAAGMMVASAPGAGSFAGMPAAVSNDMFYAERFSLSFTARDNAMWDVVNALSKGQPFIMIREISMDSGTPVGVSDSVRASMAARTAAAATAPMYGGGGMMPPMNVPGGYAPGAYPPGTYGAPAARPGITNIYVPREDRVVAGRELVKVSLVLDVFHFTAGKEQPK